MLNNVEMIEINLLNLKLVEFLSLEFHHWEKNVIESIAFQLTGCVLLIQKLFYKNHKYATDSTIVRFESMVYILLVEIIIVNSIIFQCPSFCRYSIDSIAFFWVYMLLEDIL